MAPGEPLQIYSRTNNNNNNNVVHPVSLPLHYDDGSIREVKHYKKWFPWLIPFFVVANVIVFVITMYVNNCPHNSVSCVARSLRRFSFQPLKENPLLGPSSLTLVLFSFFPVNFYLLFILIFIMLKSMEINLLRK